MASAIRTDTPDLIVGSRSELRARQMCIAEITEMIHVHIIILSYFLELSKITGLFISVTCFLLYFR